MILEEMNQTDLDNEGLEATLVHLVNEEGEVKNQFRAFVLEQLGIKTPGIVSKLNISRDGFNQEGRWTYKLVLALRPHYVWSNAIIKNIQNATIIDKTLVIKNLASEKFFASLRRQNIFEYLKNAQPATLCTLNAQMFYDGVKQLISPDNEGVYSYLLNNNLGFVNSFFIRSIAKTLGIPMHWEIGSIQINPSHRLLEGFYVVDIVISYDKSNNVIWERLDHQATSISDQAELSLSRKTLTIHNVPTSYSYHHGFIQTKVVTTPKKKHFTDYFISHHENKAQEKQESFTSSQLLNNFNPGGFVLEKDFTKWLTPVGIKEVEAIRSVKVITYRYQTREGNHEIALEVTLKNNYQWSNLDVIKYPFQITDDNQILIRVPTSLSHTQLLLDLGQLTGLRRQVRDADMLAKYAHLDYLDEKQNIKPLFLTDWLEALKITVRNYSHIEFVNVEHMNDDQRVKIRLQLVEPYRFKVIGDYDSQVYQINNQYDHITISFDIN